jgi:hypothetical protein
MPRGRPLQPQNGQPTPQSAGNSNGSNGNGHNGGGFLSAVRGEAFAVVSRTAIMLLMPIVSGSMYVIYQQASSVVQRLDNAVERLAKGLNDNASNVHDLDQSIKYSVTTKIDAQKDQLGRIEDRMTTHEQRLYDLEHTQPAIQQPVAPVRIDRPKAVPQKQAIKRTGAAALFPFLQ